MLKTKAKTKKAQSVPGKMACVMTSGSWRAATYAHTATFSLVLNVFFIEF